MEQEGKSFGVVWVHEVAFSKVSRWVSRWVVGSGCRSRDWVSASWVVFMVIVDAWTPDSVVLGLEVWVVVERRGFRGLCGITVEASRVCLAGDVGGW